MKDKNNVIDDYNKMIMFSWTYEKMTNDEKNRWNDILNHTRISKCLRGNYDSRWDILNAIYHAYLIGIGYTDFKWRCNNG